MEMTKKKNSIPVWIIVILLLVFIFVFPRILISTMGAGSPWTSYLYQYGLGAITFLIGINLIKKSGSCQPGRGRDSLWFRWIIIGFFLFAIVHLVWIILALSIPVKGGM
jgi:membrane protease YdiL (CAAX protease family)